MRRARATEQGAFRRAELHRRCVWCCRLGHHHPSAAGERATGTPTRDLPVVCDCGPQNSPRAPRSPCKALSRLQPGGARWQAACASGFSRPPWCAPRIPVLAARREYGESKNAVCRTCSGVGGERRTEIPLSHDRFLLHQCCGALMVTVGGGGAPFFAVGPLATSRAVPSSEGGQIPEGPHPQ
jgi:hypothetical protein